ncbi:MAG: tripartite tricarboxylate transporter substrate binding protein [Burkholderiales bacterium]|nr:tripartite tricarboxylate transporter substrate binding protein [Burkholderiales bacterium]
MGPIFRIAFAVIATLAGQSAPAQDKSAADAYPNRPVRLIIPYAVGGATDIVGRIVGQKLGERLGQQVVIDNRTGAGAIIGTEILARSAPDGYTMMSANIAHGANPYLHKKLPYDTVKHFAPVTLMVVVPMVLVVHPSVTARSVPEFVTLAKAKPGQLTFGTAGTGSANHLAMELFKFRTGTNIIHVPYKGGAPAIADLIAGQITSMFSTVAMALPHIQAGKTVAFGLSGHKRSSALPNVPTVGEMGIAGAELYEWQGILVPAGTPAAIIGRLHRDIAGVLGLPDVRERIAGLGADVVGSTPAQFAEHIQKELAIWGKVIPSAGIQAN